MQIVKVDLLLVQKISKHHSKILARRYSNGSGTSPFLDDEERLHNFSSSLNPVMVVVIVVVRNFNFCNKIL